MNTKLDTLSIRPACEDDFSTLFAMEEAAHETPWPKSTFTQMLGSNNVQCFIAEQAPKKVSKQVADKDKTNICAFSFVQSAADEATLLNIVVDTQNQGKGIGRWLLNQIIEQLMQEGKIHSLFLEVRVSNFSAIALYLSCGFTEVGVRNSYYPRKNGGREDGLILALPLETFNFEESS